MVEPQKSTRWAFTAYEPQWSSLDVMPEVIARWGWQPEICPKTQRKHWQGYMLTRRSVRRSQLSKLFPVIHFEVARNWTALLKYCEKVETRDASGVAVHAVNPNAYVTMAGALSLLPPFMPGDDININMSAKEEYWYCVRGYIRDSGNYESIGLFTNPQMLVAWTNTKLLWIDRQTDIRDEAIHEANEIVASMYSDETPRPPPPCEETPNAPPWSSIQQPEREQGEGLQLQGEPVARVPEEHSRYSRGPDVSD
nr:MAG: replication associated protein [Cressdnaviricota sp.]